MSLYERALRLGRILEAGWRRSACGCCFVPPWETDGPTWDEDEALALIEVGS